MPRSVGGARSAPPSSPRAVRVEVEGVVAYADGERIAALPVDIEMDAGSLRVLA